jgi:hypothetical protein
MPIQPVKVSLLFLNRKYGCVLIGAGVRTDDEYVLLFETLLNVVHTHASKAKICFNTGPFDSVNAVQRWV